MEGEKSDMWGEEIICSLIIESGVPIFWHHKEFAAALATMLPWLPFFFTNNLLEF